MAAPLRSPVYVSASPKMSAIDDIARDMDELPRWASCGTEIAITLIINPWGAEVRRDRKACWYLSP